MDKKDKKQVSSLELFLMESASPELSDVPARYKGAACLQCGDGRLDYNGLLQLECPGCGFVSGEGGDFAL